MKKLRHCHPMYKETKQRQTVMYCYHNILWSRSNHCDTHTTTTTVLRPLTIVTWQNSHSVLTAWVKWFSHTNKTA